MVAKYARGQDIEVTIRVNGEPLNVLSINSGTWTPGLNMEEVNEAGKATPVVDGFNAIVQLQLDTNPTPELYDIITLQRQANDGEIELDIDAEFTIDFARIGLLGIRRYLMPDCVLHEPSTPIPGGTDRLTNTFTLSSSKYKVRQ
jgi:hypothetical protein